jgi:hypothetical protein
MVATAVAEDVQLALVVRSCVVPAWFDLVYMPSAWNWVVWPATTVVVPAAGRICREVRELERQPARRRGSAPRQSNRDRAVVLERTLAGRTTIFVLPVTDSLTFPGYTLQRSVGLSTWLGKSFRVCGESLGRNARRCASNAVLALD